MEVETEAAAEAAAAMEQPQRLVAMAEAAKAKACPQQKAMMATEQLATAAQMEAEA